MLFKIWIVLLFIAIILSLSSALYFLFKDVGDPKKRTLYALGVRLLLAILLVGSLVYGYLTGELGSTAPWDRQLHPELVAPDRATGSGSQHIDEQE